MDLPSHSWKNAVTPHPSPAKLKSCICKHVVSSVTENCIKYPWNCMIKMNSAKISKSYNKAESSKSWGNIGGLLVPLHEWSGVYISFFLVSENTEQRTRGSTLEERNAHRAAQHQQFSFLCRAAATLQSPNWGQGHVRDALSSWTEQLWEACTKCWREYFNLNVKHLWPAWANNIK